MKFTLIYDGPLPSAGNRSKPSEQWEIRKQLDPQLRELWDVDGEFKKLSQDSKVRRDGRYFLMPAHHLEAASVDTAIVGSTGTEESDNDWIDLCAPVRVGGKSFVPLVRDSLALTCGLRIQFLRREAPGRVYQGGDLDGRIKLLLDALSVPQDKNAIREDANCPNPLYCLMENDTLITSLDVRSERLLVPRPDTSPHEVRLIITVDVRVSVARQYNSIFLGG